MKSVRTKGGNDDGIKKQQQQQAGPALFPRLNVAEAKQAGPRAPPRNKMALYEQFTIPSHRYKSSPMPLPSSGRVAVTPSFTPIYHPQMQVQAGSYDSRYSYVPISYMNPISPGMAYMPMMNVGLAGAGGSVLMNTSSSRSTVVDGATELQRVPLVGETHTRTPKSSHHTKHSLASRERKSNDDFAVPTYSSATQGSSQTRVAFSPHRGQGSFRCQPAGHKGRDALNENRPYTGVKEHQGNRMETSVEVMSKEQNDDASWPAGSGECVTASINDSDVGTQEPIPLDSYECLGEPDDSEIEPDVSDSGLEHEQEQEQEMGRGDELAGRHEGFIKTIPATDEAAHKTVHEGDSLKRWHLQDHLGSQSSENYSGGEMAEPSHATRGSSDETESSILENVPMVGVSHRDVVDAFSQQEFFKARRTIMRQQKVFSQQVFELHQLIEVQHLLSNSPSLMFNIDDVDEEEVVPVHCSPVAEVPEVPEAPARSTEIIVNSSVKSITRPVVETSPQPSCPVRTQPQQDLSPAQPWQPFRANPWASRMASPYMHMPYLPCPPGYGVYPYMGSDMAMYDQTGRMRGAQYPVWLQSGIPQYTGSSYNPAAAWYGRQQPPVAGPTATVANSDSDHSGASLKDMRGTPTENCREGGESVVAERPFRVDAKESFRWAKGWGRAEGKWKRKDQNMLRNKECLSSRQECDSECQGFDKGGDEFNQASREESTEGGAHCRERGQDNVEQEPEKLLPTGASQPEAVQGRALKRPRLESNVSPWFHVVSPLMRNRLQSGGIKIAPRAVVATPESAASILLSIQKEGQK